MEINEETLTVLYRCVDLIADAIVKKTCPVMDDISENQAIERYGSKWIKLYKERKGITPHRIGKRIVFSIHELNCLKVAERDNYEAIMRALGKKTD